MDYATGSAEFSTTQFAVWFFFAVRVVERAHGYIRARRVAPWCQDNLALRLVDGQSVRGLSIKTDLGQSLFHSLIYKWQRRRAQT